MVELSSKCRCHTHEVVWLNLEQFELHTEPFLPRIKECLAPQG